MEIESSHVVSYLLVIVTICLESPIKDLQQYETYHDLGQGHLRSNVKMGIESSYMLSYQLVIVTTCLESPIKELQLLQTFMTLV
jgi:hypothetical protein